MNFEFLILSFELMDSAMRNDITRDTQYERKIGNFLLIGEKAI